MKQGLAARPVVFRSDHQYLGNADTEGVLDIGELGFRFISATAPLEVRSRVDHGDARRRDFYCPGLPCAVAR